MKPVAPRPLRVLVIDADPDSAESLCLLARGQGHEAAQVPDGSSAIEAAALWGPDLVLLRGELPGADACEVARWVRAQARGRPCLVAALGPWHGEGDRDRWRGTDADCCLPDPLDPGLLREILRDLSARLPRLAGRRPSHWGKVLAN